MPQAERAGYTVTMFCIDVSASMGRMRTVEVPDGEEGETREVEMTNLEWSVQYVLLKIQEMIFNGRKTDQCGVILFGAEETSNIINEKNGGYERVVEYIPIAQPNASTIAKLQELQPSEDAGDPIDALIVAIETQDDYLKKKKTWTRRMVLLTDGESPMEVEDWELTVKKIKELNIITTVIGVDFDDEEFGIKQEDKSKIKLENEKFFHMFVSSLGEDLGRIGTAAEALYECQRPDVKITKSVMSGITLRLGDFDTRPDEAIELPVKMSKCTALARPATMKKFIKRTAEADEDGSMQVDAKLEENEKDIYAQLKMQTEYIVDKAHNTNGDDDKDDKQDGEGKVPEKVDRDELVRGFKYGASYVPCPDGQFPRLSTQKGLDICGFFPSRFIRRDYGIGEVSYVWPDPTNSTNQIAFSSIVQAMLSQNVVAIARYVSRDEMDPRMGILVPREFEKIDCFLWLMMPFADDVRRYVFPPLLNPVSKKGEKVEIHPFLPTREQEEAMEKFVDSMDLMQAGEKDEEGNRGPWFDPRMSYNPAVHRIKQALFHAAIVSDLRTNPLPPPHAETIKYFEPPRRVLKRAHQSLEECKQKFEIRQVPPKVVKQRKDGHVRADDDDDEPLLLDQPTKYTPEGTKSQPSSTLKPTQNDTSLASESTFVNNPTPSSVLVKGAEKGEKMDIDSETEDEDEGKDDMDNKNVRQKAGDQPAEQLETPPPTLRSLDQSESQAESQSQFQSQSQSQFIASESGSQPLAPTNSQISNVTFSAVPSSSSSRIGLARPLQDFKAALKADKSGGRDLLRGLVKELGEVVREIVVAPLSGRRYEEMRECLREAKEVCYKEQEKEAWNSTIQTLTSSVQTGLGKPFYDFLSLQDEDVGLIF